MVVKKITAFLLAVALCFSVFCALPAYAAEETEAKLTGVSVVYAPLTSRIVWGTDSPILSGVVLKLTYDDGSSETATVKLTDEGFKANGYNVRSAIIFAFPAYGVAVNYGLHNNPIVVEDGENRVEDDFYSFYIMPLDEFLYWIGTIN